MRIFTQLGPGVIRVAESATKISASCKSGRGIPDLGSNRITFLLLTSLFLTLFASNVFAQAELSIGEYAQGVYSGSEPFNTSGTCSAPGDDCNNTDNRIRTADTINYTWSITAQNIPNADPDIHSVILEQTIVPDANAELIFERIPTICLAPPVGPGGSDPASSITENADGSLTLLCNLGTMGNGDQKSFTVSVKPLGSSENDSTFTTEQKVYGLNADGSVVVNDTPYVNPNTYSISAAPTWDLNANMRTLYRYTVANQDVGTGRGTEPGFYLYTSFGIGAAAESAGKGISALSDSFDIDFELQGFSSDGTTPYPFEYKIVHCRPNTTGWSGAVRGIAVGPTHAYYEKSVVNSGSCAVSGDSTSGHTLTINNADTNGSRWPTRTFGNRDLSAGPYYASTMRVLVFVPFSEIERENDTDNSGQIYVKECLNNFDPSNNMGLSNYLQLFHSKRHRWIFMDTFCALSEFKRRGHRTWPFTRNPHSLHKQR